MSLRTVVFADLASTVRRVRELALTPFTEKDWADRINSYPGWKLEKDDVELDRHIIVFDERRDLFRNNEAYQAERDPDAFIRFSKPEFSLWLDYLVDEPLKSGKARVKFADAFALTSREVCAALGQPDQRVHFVHDFLETMTFCACIWEFDRNDLFLIQDLGDLQGVDGVIDLRILPSGGRPARLPGRSAFS